MEGDLVEGTRGSKIYLYNRGLNRYYKLLFTPGRGWKRQACSVKEYRAALQQPKHK